MLGWALLAAVFTIIGGGSLDLDRVESRLGIAASEGIGPLGQVYGGWDPALWPGRMLPSQLWASWGEWGRATSASVRWPEAIAVIAVSLVVFRSLASAQGPLAGLLGALATLGSLGLIHRGSAVGVDWIAGMTVVIALSRILRVGSDPIAGIWAGLAFLAGGWPPLAMILLPIIVIGRASSRLTFRFFIPVIAAIAGWCLWTLRVASPEALAAALTLPLMAGPDWTLALEVLLWGLPFTPFAFLAAWRSLREDWSEAARTRIADQLRIGVIAILAGTLIPGMAPTARLVALAAFAQISALALYSFGMGKGSRSARIAATTLVVGVVLLWALIAVPLSGYLAVAISYYRPMGSVLVGFSLALLVATVVMAARGGSRWGLVGALLLVAVGVKLGHFGVYVPEWNYRFSQGPWGRAVARWVPPNQPIYLFHVWREDLMFHTKRPVRQLPEPQSLSFHSRDRALFVLLLPSEFEHWPKAAPAISKVRELEDERGSKRVLACTDGRLVFGPDALILE